jgi:SAM-dependent methyltransferase
MKFKKVDEKYLAERKEFSSKYGKRDIWEVMDHWPLYVGNSNLQRVLSIYELLKTTINVPGHIAEFGSWKGSNVMFEGLTEFDEKDNEAISLKGAYRGNLEELTDLMALNSLNDNINIQKGYIENTLPALLEADPALSFSLVYCDTDLYASTKVILDSLHSRLMKGGLFIFDEWNHPTWPGETTAAREFLNEHGDKYEVLHIKNTRQPTLALKKKG